MKRLLLTVFTLYLFINPANAWSFDNLCFFQNSDEKRIEKLLNAQVKYANKTNFDKYIATYDKNYKNADGFDYETYSNLVKDIWNTYDKIKYGIKIKSIEVLGDEAKAELTETSHALIPLKESAYNGELNSTSESIYYFKKNNGKWKVISDSVKDETTTMLYGKAKDLDIKLTVPNPIEADKEYVAALEFTPPDDMLAIASLASDVVEYPQKPTEEIFRAMPEDNILERFFTSNNKNLNEYVVASIGLTKTTICDLSVQLSLTGFGYAIKRVNVIPEENKDDENK